MSGITAVYYRDGSQADEGATRAMLAAVPYRGPDGMYFRRRGPVALGHAKLIVTPEDEGEIQPLASPRTGCMLVADARLDNRSDIIGSLPSHPAAATSDAELILLAYETWGMESLARLCGDFAFIIWDPRRHELVCARDTSGQRSLFYRVDHHSFVAASEIHQLFQDPSVPVEANDERIRDFLVPFNMFQNEKDQSATYYKHIKSIPAGHILVVGSDRVVSRRYWDLGIPTEIRYRTDQEYAEHFRALFFDVMRGRLRSARPVGALLSGGLDSSTVVCSAQEVLRRGEAPTPGFISFSLTFDGLECDERDFIADIRSKYELDARYVSGGEVADRLQLEPQGFRASPLYGAATQRAALFREASQSGVRIVLSGDVADGYLRGSGLIFDELLRQGRLQDLRQHASRYRQLTGASWLKIILLRCTVPMLPPSVQRYFWSAYTRHAFRRLRTRIMPNFVPEPLRDSLARRDLELRLDVGRARRFASDVRHDVFTDLYPPQVPHHPYGWPLEASAPFADRRLHSFVLSIPTDQLCRLPLDTDSVYAGQKRLVRRAMRGILPESIRTRRHQTHFASAFATALDEQWAAYQAAFGPSGRSELAERGYIDQASFWDRLQCIRRGEYGADLLYVMRTVLLETWLRTFSLPRDRLVRYDSHWSRPSTRVDDVQEAVA